MTQSRGSTDIIYSFGNPQFRISARSRPLTLLCLSLLICGCVTSPGNATIGFGSSNPEPEGEEETIRGVVNGLYRPDTEEMLANLTKFDEHLSAEQIAEYAERYVVRVGVDRAPTLSVISPITIGARWIDYVILPAGWTHSPLEISDAPQVINVGDIVDVAVQQGRRFDFLVELVRKCNEPPAEDENPDWDIGCKTYDGFNDNGYAGEFYNFRAF